MNNRRLYSAKIMIVAHMIFCLHVKAQRCQIQHMLLKYGSLREQLFRSFKKRQKKLPCFHNIILLDFSVSSRQMLILQHNNIFSYLIGLKIFPTLQKVMVCLFLPSHQVGVLLQSTYIIGHFNYYNCNNKLIS